MKKYLFLIGLVLAGSLTATAQYEADTRTPESVVKACLDIISVNKGETPDWKRMQNLLMNGASFTMCYTKNDTAKTRWFTLEQMKKMGYERTGFTETQLAIDVQQFGGMANVFQSYEARTHDGRHNQRGINSYQLIYDHGRWWISSLMWTDATRSNPLPAKFDKR